MNPTCSIVIRALNEEKHIGRLLAGIGQQTIKDVQVILVDSGSTDRTVEIAQRYAVDIVRIRPEEFTFGCSLNRGIAQSRGEYVVIASAHVYPVYPDWLERLLAPFADPRVGLTYGKQSGDERTKFPEHQVFKHWFPDQSNPNQGHPFCNNANAAIRRTLWEENPYDETLPGLEDLAWARWAQEQGHLIHYSAEAEVVHVHQETWHGIYNRYRREGMAFKHIYPQATFDLADLARLWTGNVWNDLREASRQKTVVHSLRDIVLFRWMQFWGTFRGYRQGGPLTWQLKQAFYYPRNLNPDRENHRPVQPIAYNELTESCQSSESTSE